MIPKRGVFKRPAVGPYVVQLTPTACCSMLGLRRRVFSGFEYKLLGFNPALLSEGLQDAVDSYTSETGDIIDGNSG